MPERSGAGVPTQATPHRAQGPSPRSVLGRVGGRPALKRLALITLVAGCAWAGWGLGQRNNHPGTAQRQLQQTVQREVNQLEGRLASQTASSADRQRLLSLLLGLDRQGEAIRLLEQMADQEPDRWSLRLLLADLRRNANDRSGAERELRQILNRDPGQIGALQRMALLQLEQGRGDGARAQLQGLLAKAHQPSLQPQALAIGLLLADLYQRQGDLAAAAALNQRLSREFPGDARPWLALALVRQQQGDGAGAETALGQARTRLGGQGSQGLDQVAVTWGLAAVRGPSGAPARSAGPEPGAH